MEPDRSSGVPEGISPASSLMMAVHEADFDEPRRRSARHRHGHRLERMTLKYMPGRDPNNETKQKLIIAAGAVPGPKDRSGRYPQTMNAPAWGAFTRWLSLSSRKADQQTQTRMPKRQRQQPPPPHP
jgi:hypothetical protein